MQRLLLVAVQPGTHGLGHIAVIRLWESIRTRTAEPQSVADALVSAFSFTQKTRQAPEGVQRFATSSACFRGDNALFARAESGVSSVVGEGSGNDL
jgi:hypothetical protein